MTTPVKCLACGTELQPGWRMCPQCGAAVSGVRDTLARKTLPVPPAELLGCYRQSWAVVIGINDYAHAPKLNYAVADAEAVAQTLGELGFPRQNLTLLCDAEATSQNIRDLLTVDLPRKLHADDRLVFFFAGHGRDLRTHKGTSLGYLLPVETPVDSLASRAISMKDLQDWGDLLPAKHILWLVDCCYSGLAATRHAGLDPTHVAYATEVARRPVRQVLTAGGAGEQAHEDNGHGLFTRVLLRGLRGEADLKGRGFVTGFDLGHYVEARVHEESRSRQRPLFRYIEGDGEVVFILPQLGRDVVAENKIAPTPSLPMAAQQSAVEPFALPGLSRLADHTDPIRAEVELGEAPTEQAEDERRNAQAAKSIEPLPKPAGLADETVTGKHGAAVGTREIEERVLPHEKSWVSNLLEALTPKSPGESLGDHRLVDGTCKICGCTRAAIEHFGWPCMSATRRKARLAVTGGTRKTDGHRLVGDSCQDCGCSRVAIEHFGWRCK